MPPKKPAQTNIQNRRSDTKTSSDHGRQCGRILGHAWQDPAEFLVGQHPPQKATHAGDRGTGEQDGACRLGNAEARRVLHAASLVNTRAAMKV